MAVISALENKPASDEKVRQTFEAIREAVLLEELGVSGHHVHNTEKKAKGIKQTSLRELFTGGRGQNFRRVALGVAIQCFQQVNHISEAILFILLMYLHFR